MSRFSGWASEQSVLLCARWKWMVAVVACVALGVRFGFIQIESAAHRLHASLSFADWVLMSTSPPFDVLPAPQMLLGPCAMVILMLHSLHARTDGYLARASSDELWARPVLSSLAISVALATLHLVLILLMLPEAPVEQTNFSDSSSLFALYVGEPAAGGPGVHVAICFGWLESFQIVLLECAVFLLLSWIVKNDIVAFLAVVAIASISLLYFRVPWVIESGYFACAGRTNAVRMLSPTVASALIFLVGRMVLRKQGGGVL